MLLHAHCHGGDKFIVVGEIRQRDKLLGQLWGCGLIPEGHCESSKPKDHRCAALSIVK